MFRLAVTGLFWFIFPFWQGLKQKKFAAIAVAFCSFFVICFMVLAVHFEIQRVEVLTRELQASLEDRYLLSQWKWQFRYASLLIIFLMWLLMGAIR